LTDQCNRHAGAGAVAGKALFDMGAQFGIADREGRARGDGQQGAGDQYSHVQPSRWVMTSESLHGATRV
jgi:hypothetical protein